MTDDKLGNVNKEATNFSVKSQDPGVDRSLVSRVVIRAVSELDVSDVLFTVCRNRPSSHGGNKQ